MGLRCFYDGIFEDFGFDVIKIIFLLIDTININNSELNYLLKLLSFPPLPSIRNGCGGRTELLPLTPTVSALT